MILIIAKSNTNPDRLTLGSSVRTSAYYWYQKPQNVKNIKMLRNRW